MAEQKDNVQPAEVTTVKATTVQTGNKKGLIIGLVIGGLVLLIAAVAIVVIIVLNNSNAAGRNAAGDLTTLSVSDPQGATTLLNTELKDVILAVSSGDTEALNAAVAELGQVQTANFTFNLSYGASDESIQVELTGSAEDTGGTNANFAATAEVTGNIPGLGEFTDPITIDLRFIDGVFYIKISNLPSELALDLMMYGLSENQWYELDTEAIGGAEALTNSFMEGLNAGDFNELQTSLEGKDLFTNPRATASRQVAGVDLECMLVDVNPDLRTDGDSSTTPIEICAAPSGFVPFYIGAENTIDDVTMEISLSINSLGQPVNIEVPTNTEDLLQLMSSFYEMQ